MLLSNSLCHNENTAKFLGQGSPGTKFWKKKRVGGRNKDDEDVLRRFSGRFSSSYNRFLMSLFSLSEWLFSKSFISGRISDIMSDWHSRDRKNYWMIKSNLKIPFKSDQNYFNRGSSLRFSFTFMLKKQSKRTILRTIGYIHVGDYFEM